MAEPSASSTPPPEAGNEFTREAGRPQAGFLGEFWAFLKQNKKWWITPIVVLLLLIGALILLAGSGAAPFLYPLF